MTTRTRLYRLSYWKTGDRRILGLASDISDDVFQTFDGEPEFSGEDAGRIAAAAYEAVIQTVEAIIAGR